MANGVKLPFLRTAYNYDRNQASDESGLRCEDPTLTQQQFAEEADINTIVRRFGLSGQLPEDLRRPSYGDFTGVSDFHTAVNAIAAANEAFDAMPAHVRSRFNNDPGAFVDFVAKEENRAEASALGLVDPDKARKRVKPAPQPVNPTAGAPLEPPSVNVQQGPSGAPSGGPGAPAVQPA